MSIHTPTVSATLPGSIRPADVSTVWAARYSGRFTNSVVEPVAWALRHGRPVVILTGPDAYAYRAPVEALALDAIREAIDNRSAADATVAVHAILATVNR